MRVVLDTNVLARATPSRGGPAAELLLATLKPPHIFVTSEFLLDELTRVLRYPRVRKMHGLPDNRIDAYVAMVRAGSLVVPIPQALPQAVVLPDPDDDPIIATAVLGQADVICTRDRHLHHATVVEYCKQFQIRILTDLDLLPTLRQPPAE